MAITRAKVEQLLTETIIKYGTNINWRKFDSATTLTNSGYDSLYEEAVTHDINVSNGFIKSYLPLVSFSGYPI